MSTPAADVEVAAVPLADEYRPKVTARFWGDLLAPYGFTPPSFSSRRKPSDGRWLYFIQCDDMVKVGLAYDVEHRLKGFRLAAPRGLYLRGKRLLPAALAGQVERRVHVALKDCALGREWFRTDPKTARAVAQPIIDESHRAYAVLTQHRYFLDWPYRDQFDSLAEAAEIRYPRRRSGDWRNG